MNDRILSPVIEDVKPEEVTFKVEVKRGLMTPDYEVIGSRIRDARKRAGLTQEVVAKVLGLSQPAIVAIESGSVSLTLDNLYKLSEVLNCSVAELLGIGIGDLSAKEVRIIQLARAIPDYQDMLLSILEGMAAKYGSQSEKQ